MKVQEVIKALKKLDPEADLKIVIKQYNKKYGLPLDIESDYWINSCYRGSISVHLPDGAYIARLPEDQKFT